MIRSRTTFLAALVLALVLLGGLYIYLPRSANAPGVAALSTFALVTTPPAAGEQAPVFATTRGHLVTLTIQPDRPAELHVHGLEQEMKLEAGKAAALSFDANRAGRFPIEIHYEDRSAQMLGTLEVHPE